MANTVKDENTKVWKLAFILAQNLKFTLIFTATDSLDVLIYGLRLNSIYIWGGRIGQRLEDNLMSGQARFLTGSGVCSLDQTSWTNKSQTSVSTFPALGWQVHAILSFDVGPEGQMQALMLTQPAHYPSNPLLSPYAFPQRHKSEH